MVELVYTTDLKSVASRLAGSIPAVLTKALACFRPPACSKILLLCFLCLALAGCATAVPSVPPRPPVVGSFGNFTPSPLATFYLACPINYCNTQADRYTASIPVGADLMRSVVRSALDNLRGARFLTEESEGLRVVYALDSGDFPTAGTITVEIVDLDDTQSTIVLYAQATGTSSKQNERDKTVRCLNAVLEAAKRPPGKA